MEAAVPSRRGRDRRRRIVDEAAVLFGSHGYGNVTLADVARAVGVTTPALYRHVPTKEALALAVAAAYVEETTDELAGCRQLDELVGALVAAGGRRPFHLSSYLALDPAFVTELSAPLRDALLAAEARVVDMFAAVTDLDPRILRLRLAAVLGAIEVVVRRDAMQSRPAFRRTLVAALAEMVARPPAVVPPDTADAGPTVAWDRPQAARTVVLETAVRHFRLRGFNGVGVDEIGTDAGLSGPSVYRYFASKADLLVEAFDRSTVGLLHAVDEVVASAASPEAALAGLARRYAEIAVRSADLIVVTSREGANVPPESEQRHRRRRREVLERWSVLVRPGHPRLADSDVRNLVRAAMAAARAAAVAGTSTGAAPALVTAEVHGVVDAVLAPR